MPLVLFTSCNREKQPESGNGSDSVNAPIIPYPVNVPQVEERTVESASQLYVTLDEFWDWFNRTQYSSRHEKLLAMQNAGVYFYKQGQLVEFLSNLPNDSLSETGVGMIARELGQAFPAEILEFSDSLKNAGLKSEWAGTFARAATAAFPEKWPEFLEGLRQFDLIELNSGLRNLAFNNLWINYRANTSNHINGGADSDLLEYLESTPSKPYRNSILSNNAVLQALVKLDWRRVADLSKEIGDEGLTNMLAGHLVRENPDNRSEIAEHVFNGGAKASFYANFVKTWATQDLNGMLTWVSTQSDKVYDLAIASTLPQIRENNPEAAAEWISQISDAELKEKLEAQ